MTQALAGNVKWSAHTCQENHLAKKFKVESDDHRQRTTDDSDEEAVEKKYIFGGRSEE